MNCLIAFNVEIDQQVLRFSLTFQPVSTFDLVGTQNRFLIIVKDLWIEFRFSWLYVVSSLWRHQRDNLNTIFSVQRTTSFCDNYVDSSSAQILVDSSFLFFFLTQSSFFLSFFLSFSLSSSQSGFSFFPLSLFISFFLSL